MNEQPNQVHPNQGRKFTEGARYWMRNNDGHVVPRELSQYEPPQKTGWSPVIVVEGTVVRDERPIDEPNSGMDAAGISGNQVSYDRGDTLTNHRRMARPRVSNPNALDDHQVRERIVARDAEAVTEKPQAPEGNKPRRQRKGSGLSDLAGG